MRESSIRLISACLKRDRNHGRRPPGHGKEPELVNYAKAGGAWRCLRSSRGWTTASKRIALIQDVEKLIGSFPQNPSEASKIIFYCVFLQLLKPHKCKCVIKCENKYWQLIAFSGEI